MATKKKSKPRSTVRRVTSTVRRVGGHFSKARRTSHQRMDGGFWLTKGIYALAGYSLGPAIQDSGLADVIYQMTPGKLGDSLRMLSDKSGIGLGRAVNKAAGVGLVSHALYKSRNSNKPHISNELAFGLGQLVDPDPTAQTGSAGRGYGGSSGSYWSS